MENLVYIRERIENKEVLTELEKVTEGDFNHCTLLYTGDDKFVVSMQNTTLENKTEEENLHECLHLGAVANKLASSDHYNFGIIYGSDHGSMLYEEKTNQLCKSTCARDLVSDCFQFALSLAIANQHHEGFCIDVEHMSRKHFVKNVSLKYQSVPGNTYYVEVSSALRYHRYYQGCALRCLRSYCELFGFHEARCFLEENACATLSDFINYLFVIDLKCKMCIVEKSPSCQLAHRVLEFKCELVDNIGSNLYVHYLHNLANGGYVISSELDYMSSLRSFQVETTHVSSSLEAMIMNVRPVQLTIRNHRSSIDDFNQFCDEYILMDKAFQKLQLSHKICNWLAKLTISSAFEKKVRTLRCKLREDINHFSTHLSAAKHCISSSMPLATKQIVVGNSANVSVGKREKMVKETNDVTRNVKLHA